MQLFLLLALAFTPALSHAGATYSFCGNENLPQVQFCEDQEGNYIRNEDGALLKFKFITYGEDNSSSYYEAQGSEFRFVIRNWYDRFLVDSEGREYPLQCDFGGHGTCKHPRVK